MSRWQRPAASPLAKQAAAARREAAKDLPIDVVLHGSQQRCSAQRRGDYNCRRIQTACAGLPALGRSTRGGCGMSTTRKQHLQEPAFVCPRVCSARTAQLSLPAARRYTFRSTSALQRAALPRDWSEAEIERRAGQCKGVEGAEGDLSRATAALLVRIS